MTDQNAFYVYVLFRPWDGTPCYVGKGKGNRWRTHEQCGENHPNGYLARILKKASRLGLECPKIKVRDGLSEQQAFEIEVCLIKAIGRVDAGAGTLVNFTDGGEGASGMTLAAREKIIASKLGKPRSRETIEKMRTAATGRPAWNRGRKASAQAIMNQSLAHKGNPSPNLGKSMSTEQKEKIRLARLGQRLSSETRQKISDSNRIRWAAIKAGKLRLR